MDVETVLNDLKRRKEEFVTGHSGSSIGELRDVSLAGVLCNAAWIYAVSKRPQLKSSFWLDFVLNWLGLLFSVTVFGKQPLYIVVAAAMVVFLVLNSYPNSSQKLPERKQLRLSPTLTLYRSSMLILTSFAILAVDFPIFPRKYAKVETWGVSLMDLGVGSFVFSNGIVSYKRFQSGLNVSKWSKVAHSLRSTAILVALGLIRLFSVKATNYQEHVTEYGTHWNFFFTLSLLPVVMIILDFSSLRLRFIVSLVAAGIYELYLVYHPTFLSYLLNAQRVNFISANREGVFSFIGYCIIYVSGQQVGRTFFSKSNGAMTVFWRLVRFSITSCAVSYFLIETHSIQISRRFATLSYSSTVVSFNLLILTFYSLIGECLPAQPAVSRSYEAVNGNGMAMFLVSNLTTGLVNFTFNTLDSPPSKAMIILSLYALFLALFALKFPFKLKF